MGSEQSCATNKLTFSAFFAINFLVGFGAVSLGAYMIAMSQVVTQNVMEGLLVGVVIFIPGLLVMYAEWLGWKRKNIPVLTILSIVCLVLAVPALGLVVLLSVEAAQKGWHISHSMAIPGGVVAGIYLIACGVYRLRYKTYLTQYELQQARPT